MKERPILMSAPMVRALLDGRKTQTRRVLKPQPIDGNVLEVGPYAPTIIDADGVEGPGKEGWGASSEYECIRCPYGKPGDRLWVRETWATYGMEALPRPERPLFYRADDDTREGWTTPPDLRWRPSIYMPHWASRITLEVTEVRVQRLQEITEADAVAEGCESEPVPAPDNLSDPRERELASAMVGGQFTAKLAFLMLWDELHGQDASFANPWVWAVGFRVLNPEQAAGHLLDGREPREFPEVQG